MGEYHAIQCKFYDPNHTIAKNDIDSFFTAFGQQPFVHRLIVASTDKWGSKAEKALIEQHIPVTKIDLAALKRVCDGLMNTDRGKMIMACGTGKTFTSLKIAEQVAGADKRVLFMVPSLALLSQTLTEWTQQKSIPMHSFAVCSDRYPDMITYDGFIQCLIRYL